MRLAFGNFELDADARELRCAGAPVKVQPKVLQLIHYLVTRRDRLVDKTELLRALWPREHVTESSLFVCVRGARAALGQRHAENQPIATVRGRGYRFVAEVHELPPPPVAARPHAASLAAPDDGTDPFVGREDVMQTLSAALTMAVAGEGTLYLLRGEPGIGKTRCADELVKLARARGVRALTGRALEGEGAPSFWPWLQVLRQLALETDGEHAREAREIIALLEPRPRDQRDPAADPQDRFWLLDRSCRVLCGAAANAPRLFVLDDLQWADEGSLRLLEVFAAELRGCAALVVATLRDPRPAGSPEREHHLRRLGRAAMQVVLTGLPLAAVSSLVAASDAHAPALLSAQLRERAAGNPLFLREMLRLLRQGHTGATTEQALAALEVPRAVRDVVRTRVEQLPRSASEMLKAASVLGREVDLTLLRRLVDQDGLALAQALDGALREQLLSALPAEGRYVFVHDLLREVVYDDLTPAERLRYHRRAAEALLSQSTDDSGLGAIAYHFHCAIGDDQHESVLHYARRAGEAAMRRYAFADAARYFDWALSALAFRKDGDPRVQAELLIALGAARLALGDSTGSRRTLQKAVELAERQRFGDVLAFAGMLMRPISAMGSVSDPLALRALTRAEELLPEDGVRLRVSVLSKLACIPPNTLDMSVSKRLSERAVALARSTGGRRCLVEALDATLYSLTGPDDVDALLRVADEVIALESKRPSPWSYGLAHYYRFHALLYRGDKAGADRALDDFGRAVNQTPYREPIALHDRLRAQQLFHQGELRRAHAQYVELHERGKRFGFEHADLFFDVQMAELRLAREGYAGAEPPRLSSETADISSVPAFRAAWLAGLIESGHGDAARAELRQLAANGFSDIPRDFDYLFALAKSAEAATMLGERDAATALYALLEPYASYTTPNMLSFCKGSAAHFLGLLAAFLGEHVVARDYYEQALHANEALGFALALASTRCAYGRLLATGTRGDRARARKLCEDALRTGEQIGSGPIATAARAVLAALA